MLRKVLLLSPPPNLTAAVNLLYFSRRSDSASRCIIRRYFSDSRSQTRVTELPRVDSLVASNLRAGFNLLNFSRRSNSASRCSVRRYFSDSPSQNGATELPRVDSLIEGCDYKHWLVVMKPPDNYPEREEIIQQYVATLAMALGSEKAAKESIYSVSTKYYYAFSCKVDEIVTHKIKCLPRVKWVLPDSYLCDEECGYGGEPFVDGKVVPYEENYHADWSRDVYFGEGMERTCMRKPRRRRRRSSTNATND